MYRSLELDDGSLVSQAGLFGASYFAVVYVVNRLASNLIRQEQLAALRDRLRRLERENAALRGELVTIRQQPSVG